MEQYPYAKYHKFVRAENYRNKACSMIHEAEARGQSPDDIRIFRYIYEALLDVSTGLLDLIGEPYNKSWPLSRHALLLKDIIPNLPFSFQVIDISMLDRLYTGATSKELLQEAVNVSKEMVAFAAGFGEQSPDLPKRGKFLLMVLRLLERYSDSEIAEATRIPVSKPHLDWLYSLSEGEKGRINAILSNRRNMGQKKRLADYLRGVTA